MRPERTSLGKHTPDLDWRRQSFGAHRRIGKGKCSSLCILLSIARPNGVGSMPLHHKALLGTQGFLVSGNK